MSNTDTLYTDSTPAERKRSALSRFWNALIEGMTPPPSPSLDKSTSLRIRIARPMCIFFMVLVHVNPGVAEVDLATHGVRLADWVRYFFADGVGRTSIGLLAIVSGFLAISTARVFPFGKFAMKRVRSLLIPMVVWSALLLMAYIAGDQVQPGYLEHQVGEAFAWSHIPNWLFGITDHPANFPLGFLRDLFICALLTPVIVLAMRKFALPVLAVLFVLMVTHAPSPFLGNNIPLFYSMGIWFALNGQTMERWIDRHAGKVILAFVIYALSLTTMSFQVQLHPNEGLEPIFTGLMEVERLFGAAAFWAIAGMILKTNWKSLITRLEPFAFFVFCSHIFLTTMLWMPFKFLVGDYYHPAYLVFFFLCPVLTFGLAIVGALMLGKLMPPVSAVLNGGRPLPKHAIGDLFRAPDAAVKPPKEPVGSKSVFN